METKARGVKAILAQRKIKKDAPKPNDFLMLGAMLRAREPKMLTREKLERILDSASFEDALRGAAEVGYNDLAGRDSFGIEDALSARRAELYAEIAAFCAAVPVLDLFRARYDCHNVKALVKAMGANQDASGILSHSGIVPPDIMIEAFITGERAALPEWLKSSISDGVGILARTKNPQAADVAIDARYYAFLVETSRKTGCEMCAELAKLHVDAANLRTFVRAKRNGKGADFLKNALFAGGNVPAGKIAAFGGAENADELARLFKTPELAAAASLLNDALAGKMTTQFERECDNAPYRLAVNTKYTPFGAEAVLEYLLALDFEITALRMALTGLRAGVAPEVLRERIRGNV